MQFPRTAPHSSVFWEGHADSASQSIRGFWFFQLSTFAARSLLNVDKFCFYLVFCPSFECNFAGFFVSDPITLHHSLCYFSVEIWKWKTHHKCTKCKHQVEFHCVTQFMTRNRMRKVRKHVFVSDHFLESSFFTACVLNITPQNLPLF